MSRFSNIIFLDEEGTGLSPYAEMMFRWKLRNRGLSGFNVMSRGNVVLFPEPANQKLAELARMKGFSLDNYSAKAFEGEFSECTLILTMDGVSKQKVYDRFPHAANVYMLREYVGESGDIRLPWGGSIEEYDAVCATVDRVTDRLLDKLTEMPEQGIL
ncbi:MAG: hypothetical protein HUJ76_01620 [Parasporobacterium sp.]|nr:hypothetical protein [Parasporobacterium sp.]